MEQKRKILIIVGPTASGKSALAVELAKKLGGEIISADSRQVYTGLDIGTGKITKREMKGVPHHLLDISSPKNTFTAEDFATQARTVIEDVSKRGKLPIVVGGTGFYIDSLVGRITLPDVPPNKKLRAVLQKKTTTQLFAMLSKRDPKRAKALSTPSERNNKIRLIRALEIADAIGKIPAPKDRSLYDSLWIGTVRSGAELRARINKRLKDRIKKGMVEEAQALKKSGLSYKRMTELGLEYRSLAKMLQKKITRAEMERELQSEIWRYARKQIGYWKRNKDIQWYNPKQTVRINSQIKHWL